MIFKKSVKEFVIHLLAISFELFVHGAFPILAQIIFINFAQFVQLLLVFIFGSVLYVSANYIRTWFSELTWKRIRNSVFVLFLGLLGYLIFFSAHYLRHTHQGFYIKGSVFTDVGQKRVVEEGKDEDKLVAGFTNNPKMVWIDSDKKKSDFIDLTFTTTIIFLIGSIAAQQVRRYAAIKTKMNDDRKEKKRKKSATR